MSRQAQSRIQSSEPRSMTGPKRIIERMKGSTGRGMNIETGMHRRTGTGKGISTGTEIMRGIVGMKSGIRSTSGDVKNMQAAVERRRGTHSRRVFAQMQCNITG